MPQADFIKIQKGVSIMAKYVLRFSPDYFATSLWAVNNNADSDLGANINYEDLGLSAELIKRLEKFDDSIFDIIDWSNPGGDSPLTEDERNQIYLEGLSLLELVRTELGKDFEVENDLDWINPKQND